MHVHVVRGMYASMDLDIISRYCGGHLQTSRKMATDAGKLHLVKIAAIRVAGTKLQTGLSMSLMPDRETSHQNEAAKINISVRCVLPCLGSGVLPGMIKLSLLLSCMQAGNR